MDERHWWFASKLQETFRFGGYDNPTLLEDFLSDSEVVDLINDFLSTGDPSRLFFYCDEVPSLSTHGSQSPIISARDSPVRAPSTTRRLHVTSQLSKDVISLGKVSLYVLRRDSDGDVDVTTMEKEIFCGELRHSVLSSLAVLLREAYTPLLHTSAKWGECNRESIANFLNNFDKFSAALSEMSSRAQVGQPLLEWPSRELRSEAVLQHGKGALLGGILTECEALVTDWVGSIESLLIETTDER